MVMDDDMFLFKSMELGCQSSRKGESSLEPHLKEDLLTRLLNFLNGVYVPGLS